MKGNSDQAQRLAHLQRDSDHGSPQRRTRVCGSAHDPDQLRPDLFGTGERKEEIEVAIRQNASRRTCFPARGPERHDMLAQRRMRTKRLVSTAHHGTQIKGPRRAINVTSGASKKDAPARASRHPEAALRVRQARRSAAMKKPDKTCSAWPSALWSRRAGCAASPRASSASHANPTTA